MLLGREEGGADGGVVVQDCLELMNNLLRGNSSNQRMFRYAPEVTTLLWTFLVWPKIKVVLNG